MSARRLALLGVAIGVICAAFIALYTGYPHEPQRRYIFDFLLRTQDLPAAALVILIAAAAAWPALARPGIALAETIGRRPWTAAAITFAALCAAQLLVVKGYPLAGDDHLVLMHAKAFDA